MTNFQKLYEFIDTAVRSRKYPEATAISLRSALKLFEKELNPEELASIDVFKSHLEQIYQGVFSKNKTNFSVSSITTYKSRVLKVLNDYQTYGIDPSKMANWSPKVISRAKKVTTSTDASQQENHVNPPTVVEAPVAENMHKIELALRPDAKFVLIVPRDITQAECVTLNAILTSLSTGSK